MIPGPELVISCPRCGALHRRQSLRSGNTFGAEVWTDGWSWSPMLPTAPLVARCEGCGRLFWVGRAEHVGEIDPFSQWPQIIATLTLEQAGPRRVEVMQLLRSMLGGSLHEVKAQLGLLPLPVGHGLDRETLGRLFKRLQELGAHATLEETRVEDPSGAPPREWAEAPWIKPPDEAGWLEAIADGLAWGRDEERELRLQAWRESNAPYRRGTPWKPFSMRPHAARDNLRALLALCSPEEPMERLLKAEALRELERFEEARAVLAGGFPEELLGVAEALRALAEQAIPEVRRLDGLHAR